MPATKKNANAVKAGTMAKTGVIVLLIVGSCVGYVWLKKEIATLSSGIRVREARLKTLRENNDKLKPALAGLLSPESLDRKVKELKLGLSQPDVSHIWRLQEPAETEAWNPARKPVEYYAEQKPLRAQAP